MRAYDPRANAGLFMALLFMLTYPVTLRAVEKDVSNVQKSGDDDPAAFTNLPNLRLPTIGGKQFWTDHCWQNGWRIQQNAMTGHWRLLDPENVRFAWGSRAACEAELATRQPAAVRDRVEHVVLVHGLFRSAGSMQKLGEFLEEDRTRRIVCFEYASTRGSIGEHAAALREVVEGLPPDVPLSFVGHSMGNIVIRHAIGDWEAASDEQVHTRVQAIVMLGPPNQGAAIARQLAKVEGYGWIAGQGGLELGPEWDSLEPKLAVPQCPVGIIAGRLPNGFANPLVGEAGDFVVSVEETRLPGGTMLEVNQLHSLLMDNATVQQRSRSSWNGSNSLKNDRSPAHCRQITSAFSESCSSRRKRGGAYR